MHACGVSADLIRAASAKAGLESLPSRIASAQRPNVNPVVLCTLALDNDVQVRRAVAERVNSIRCGETILYLADNNDETVRRLTMRNLEQASDMFTLIAKQGTARAQRMVAASRYIPREAAERLAASTDIDVRVTLAKACTFKVILRELLNDADGRVRAAVLSNPNRDPAWAESLQTDRDSRVSTVARKLVADDSRVQAAQAVFRTKRDSESNGDPRDE